MTPRTRTLTTAAVVAAAGALVAVTAVSAVTAQPRTPDRASSSHTLTFLATATGGGPVDTPPTGTSAGDEFFGHGTLAKASNHGQGTFTLATTLVDAAKARQYEQQTVTLYLAHGSIEISGGHPSVNRFSVPVVGGTGGYAGARGVARFSSGPHGQQKITVTLMG